MYEPEFLREAQRQLGVCNACRYCEGFCAVFPALELRAEVASGDLTYLANLCHDCRDCYTACMFTPPHEFAVNIPKVLAEARVRTYEHYSRPRAAGLFRRSLAGTAAISAGGIVAVALLVAAFVGPGVLTAAHRGPGAFGADVPYVMALGQLVEQPRACNVLANLVGCDPEDVRIGMPVQIGYVDIPSEGVTMYQWLPR